MMTTHSGVPPGLPLPDDLNNDMPVLLPYVVGSGRTGPVPSVEFAIYIAGAGCTRRAKHEEAPIVYFASKKSLIQRNTIINTSILTYNPTRSPIA